MIKIIEKPLKLEDHQTVKLPIETAILSVISKGNELLLVCEIDSSKTSLSELDIFLVYSEEEILFQSRQCVFIGSVEKSGNFIHVFVKPKSEISI